MRAKPKFQFSLRTAMIIFLIASCGVGVSVSCVRYLRELSIPAPVRYWKAHRSELEKFAEDSFASNTLGIADFIRPSQSSISVPAFLVESDIGSVQVYKGVMVITFKFMPTDAVPNLVYCSERIAGTPLPQRESHMTYFKTEELSQKWIYYVWDN